MPLPTPFHLRTAPLCESHEWRNWSGYLVAATYLPTHEQEYYAIRNAAAMIDVSPLFKYEVAGPDVLALVNRIMTREFNKCAPGQVMYTPWCDDQGKVIDDGTVARLDIDRFRITSAEPNDAWFDDCAIGLNVNIRNVSEELATLAVQGPNSSKILRQVIKGLNLDGLKYYHIGQGTMGGEVIQVSRTGYTGDRGYELWLSPDFAVACWDILMEAGSGLGLMPAGMVPLDIARIEAGLLLIQVDYISSRKALIESQKSSPFELGLGWTVDLDKEFFIGKRALVDEQLRSPRWRLVGLDIDWLALEAEYMRHDLVPQVTGRASRSALPVYRNGRQIGQATSITFTPILKKYIALATIDSRYVDPGNQVDIEVTVEYARRSVKATTIKLPFYNPPHKRN